jgi:hypothetical protein
MEPNRFRHYIGINGATEAHRIGLVDHQGQVCERTGIPHSGEAPDESRGGLLGLLRSWLRCWSGLLATASYPSSPPCGSFEDFG